MQDSGYLQKPPSFTIAGRCLLPLITTLAPDPSSLPPMSLLLHRQINKPIEAPPSKVKSAAFRPHLQPLNNPCKLDPCLPFPDRQPPPSPPRETDCRSTILKSSIGRYRGPNTHTTHRSLLPKSRPSISQHLKADRLAIHFGSSPDRRPNHAFHFFLS